MIRSVRTLAVSATLLSLASFGSVAHAQTQGSIAEAAYQEGQKLMEQGKTKEACERFMASQEADPQLATLLNLAACHEKEGRTASAWSEFTNAATQSQAQGKKDQEKYAREHVASLEKLLHKVTITATKVDGLEIRVDKNVLPLAALGTGIPFDPGERVVTAKAPGMKPWTKTITLAPGPTTSEVVVPPLEPEPVAAVPVTPPPEHHTGPDQGPEPKGTNGTKLAIGLGIGGVGLIAAGVGAYFQFGSAADHKDKSDAAAAQGNDAVRQDEFDQAKSASSIGITSMVIGAAAVGVGTYFVITSFGSVPSKASVSASTKPDFRVLPIAGPKNGGLAVVGTF